MDVLSIATGLLAVAWIVMCIILIVVFGCVFLSAFSAYTDQYRAITFWEFLIGAWVSCGVMLLAFVALFYNPFWVVM